MKRLAFLPSHLEPGQVTLARHLEAAGFSVYWIMHTAYDRHWLVRLGVDEARILDTTLRNEHRYSDSEIEDGLLRIERGRPPFVNEIIAMDRRLRLKDDRFARRYLVHIERLLAAFLIDNGIEYVSNGRDTALHLVCVKVCERLGVSVVVPTIVRNPDNRFGFCLGFRESEFITLRPVEEQHFVEAAEVLRKFRADPIVSEVSLFERRKAWFLKRLHTDFAYWIRQVYRASFDVGNDVGRYSIRRLLQMFLTKRLNALRVGVGGVFQPPPAAPFVLYGLQMQPESSIDVLASFVADQHNLVSLIAKSTPRPYEVLVKPHPDHVGGLSRRDLIALGRIPRVTLVPPNISSHDLIRRAAIVMTPSGSMAMEAALYRVPAIIFADEFFKGLPGVHYCRSVDTLPDLIPRILASPPPDDDAGIIRFMASVLANSYTGRFTNYLGPYSEQELQTLVEAYSAVFQYLGVRDGSARVGT